VVEAAGGLHSFMNRDRPLITDSGGFQVRSRQNGELVPGAAARSPKTVVCTPMPQHWKVACCMWLIHQARCDLPTAVATFLLLLWFRTTLNVTLPPAACPPAWLSNQVAHPIPPTPLP
jgi:hypothetical protein